jgi:hypothetical protein
MSNRFIKEPAKLGELEKSIPAIGDELQGTVEEILNPRQCVIQTSTLPADWQCILKCIQETTVQIGDTLTVWIRVVDRGKRTAYASHGDYGRFRSQTLCGPVMYRH